MMRARGLPMVGAIVLAAALSGCGGGSEASSGKSTSAAGTASSQSPSADAPATSPQPATSAAPSQAPSSTASTASSPASGAQAPTSDVSTQANAICTRRNRELAGTPVSGGLSTIASAATRRTEIERRALEELGKLTPPTHVAGEWGKVIAESKRSLLEIAKLAAYAGSKDKAGVRGQIASSKGLQVRLLVAGERAGLPHCSTIG